MGGQSHATATLPRKRVWATFVQEAGWVPGPFWTDVDRDSHLRRNLNTEPYIPQRVAVRNTLSQPHFGVRGN